MSTKIKEVKEEVITKPVYKWGIVGWFLSKLCINFTRWLSKKIFDKIARFFNNIADKVEAKLKNKVPIKEIVLNK